MNTTQNHLPIIDILDNLILLKDSSVVLLLQISAVNFGLLSEMEQIAIISSFAQTLNSLSFSIQILIHSTRLDISSYIHTLDRAKELQANPLLKDLMGDYRNFIASTIKENEVLDKKFYICLSVSSLELGINLNNKNDHFIKAKTVLMPKRDQILRQLSRVGLTGTQLNSLQLLKLFYEIYNPPLALEQQTQISPVRLGNPQTVTSTSSIPVLPPKTLPPLQPAQLTTNMPPTRNHPFVVEELTDTL